MTDASDFSARLEEAIAAERDRQAVAAEAERKQKDERVASAQKYRELVDKLRFEVVPPLLAQAMKKLGIAGSPEQLEYNDRNAVRTPGTGPSLVVEFAYNADGANIDARCAVITARPGQRQPLDHLQGGGHQRIALDIDLDSARQVIERMILAHVHLLMRPR